MYVRMNRAFSFKDENGTKITAPRGWVGNLPDKAAKEAVGGGYAIDGNQRSATVVEAPAPADGLDAMTKPELEALAKDRGLDVSAARTRADLIEALRKA
ncbi:SAP domain-containing protein [Methylorubrum extorquens]|uniref:SAP domain-containing protein n=1 Tax=Methylorubrum extorquens TaxID=408 RepID=UPI002237519A|nr:SAP domain-containing protein [Methylorubrum extorquens]UYW32509.1 SAP domain-containing protein [Methylorubrum extorquens]